MSLLVTFLLSARLATPFGTRKSGRRPARGASRFGSLTGTGVPTNMGFGRSSLSGTLSSARAVAMRQSARPAAASRAARRLNDVGIWVGLGMGSGCEIGGLAGDKAPGLDRLDRLEHGHLALE